MPSLRRISSWRAKRPDIVPPTVRGPVRARSAPPYHLHPGIRPARAGAILPHVPHRTAEVRPALPAFRHHRPAQGRSRRRDRVLDHRDQGGRLADPHRLRLPALRGLHPARPRRADLAHGVQRGLDLLAAGVHRHDRALHAERTGASRPSSPTRISCCCWKRWARPASPSCSRRASMRSASRSPSALPRPSRYSWRCSAPC